MTANTEIKGLLTAMGFALEEGAAGVWAKEYPIHGYRLRVDVNKEEILYGDKITLGDKTTCNFKAAENFVVLECVNRLLEQGYAPEHIYLEKDYPLGHKEKGKLDILVNDKDGKAFLMIECKTWGGEYEKATRKTLSKGGQLLSYFQQDKAAKYLCLYTSRLEGGKVESTYGVIKVEDEFAAATNTEEVFELWNKNLRDNGVFEGAPYDIIIKALTKERLKPLSREDSSRIFNQFAEILRHNVVSDKPNAFNKLITLLLCKIVDEDRAEGEELHFQWLDTDTNESLQKRLNDLYKKGMDEYLSKKVTDYSDSDIDEKFYALNPSQRDEIKRLVTELRLKKNNEFAFKEVYNTDSFNDNGKVLKEVVELLQPYKVRYNKKQQFLGDFFELLLNTSIKQEAGQFFTPVPVARFIINSIPLKEIILSKIAKGDTEFLPFVIDYAVGSGHFLTEVMDEIHNILTDLNKTGSFKPSVKNRIKTWIENDGSHYDWAYNFVYGVEKDYRLVKTAKVSCFLNGDGLARIFNADGLANFQNDADYKDKLKEIPNKAAPQDNSQFEVLIANPPYSVSAFRNTLKDGDKSFELFGRLTEDSSEIECLFIERAKQLLKPGGYAGIILPSSILSNTGIYEDARAIILKYFRVVAITEFGSGTFMATGTNTVTLFLERRTNADWQKIEHAVKTFFTNTTDVTVNGIDAAFSAYVAHVYTTISLEDYASFVRQKPNAAVLTHELFSDYRKAFDISTPVKNLRTKRPFKVLKMEEQQAKLDELFYEDVVKREQEKLLYFLLAYPQKTLLVKSNPTGKNEAEKEFLGYEFSNRRGHEGIKLYGAKTIQEATRLYDEGTSLNPEKVNTYIYKAFLGEDAEVVENLQSNVNYQRLVDMMNFERVEFSKSMSLAVKKKPVQSKWPLEPLGNVCNVMIGGTPSRNVPEYFAGGKNLWVSISEMRNKVISDTKEKITDAAVQKSNVKLVKTGTTLLSFKLSIGKTAIAGQDLYTNEAIAALEIKEENRNRISDEYLFVLFTSKLVDLEKNEFNAFGKSLNSEFLKLLSIPVPDIITQQEIIAEFARLKRDEELLLERIDRLKKDRQALTQNVEAGQVRLFDITLKIGSGATPLGGERSYQKSGITLIRSQNVHDNQFVEKGLAFISDEQANELDNVTVKEGDVLFNITGASVCRCCIVDTELLPARVNQHVAIIRTNDKALPKYVQQVLISPKFKEELLAIANSATTRQAITKTQLEDYRIPLPTLEQQRAIIAQITEIEEQMSVLQQEMDSIPQMKEAILKKYL